MKPESVASFVAAVLLHALLLFGFRAGTLARPLAVSEESAPVEVSLVEAAPEPLPALVPPTPPEPAATPEPQETPEPQPTPEMSTPPPKPESTPVSDAMPAPESTPAPEHPKTAPHRPQPRHSRPSTPHSAPGGAAVLAGPLNHGATSGPLTSHAYPLGNPKPEYPEESKREHQVGVVLLTVEVSAGGEATEVNISRSSGYPLLDDAAVRAVRRWKFEPARAGGVAVESRVNQPVHFSLSD